MSFLWRLMILALSFAVGAPLAGCAGRQGSSFETLGIPQAEDRPGRSPVIFGWAREQREGWQVRSVRIDDQAHSAWNEETQRPAIFYLRPGRHVFRVSTVQLRDPADPDSRPRRRYRVRPFRLELDEGVDHVCVVRIAGEQRRRPRVRCEEREPEPVYEDQGYDEYGDEYAEDEEIPQQPPPQQPPPEQGPSDEDEEPERPQVAEAPQTPPPPPARPGAVPSPFDPPTAPAAPPPAARPPSAPAAAPAPAAESPRPRPRPLTVEERVERLERQLEELRRQLPQD